MYSRSGLSFCLLHMAVLLTCTGTDLAYILGHSPLIPLDSRIPSLQIISCSMLLVGALAPGALLSTVIRRPGSVHRLAAAISLLLHASVSASVLSAADKMVPISWAAALFFDLIQSIALLSGPSSPSTSILLAHIIGTPEPHQCTSVPQKSTAAVFTPPSTSMQRPIPI
jgi:hypothetical protein